MAGDEGSKIGQPHVLVTGQGGSDLIEHSVADFGDLSARRAIGGPVCGFGDIPLYNCRAHSIDPRVHSGATPSDASQERQFRNRSGTERRPRGMISTRSRRGSTPREIEQCKRSSIDRF
jgi:hypothetical protein